MTTHRITENEDSEPKKHKRGYWARWISFGGVMTLATAVLAFPIIKDTYTYGERVVKSPDEIDALKLEQQNIHKQIDGLQANQNENERHWAKNDTRLEDIEKLLTRVLDNQERDMRYRNISPKQKDTNP